jgi:hypothetical protein
MHPRKASQLATFDKMSRLYDGVMRDQLSRALRPDQHGLLESLSAAVRLPIVTFAALMSDVSYIVTARTTDDDWERAFPTRGGSGASIEEQLSSSS